MKLFLSALLAFISVLFTNAQNVAINNTGTSPDASAMLDVQSTTKGMLVPRMDSTQRIAISNAADGLLVYDLDTESFWFREAAVWVELVNNAKGLRDNDMDTRVEVERTPDDDTIRFVVQGSDVAKLDGKTFHLEAPGESIYVGSGAGANDDGTLNRNTAIGFQAMHLDSPGFQNTAVGYRALYTNGSGFRNVASGFYALLNNTTGNYNIATGYSALAGNMTGHSNVGIGYQALLHNTTGSGNTAIGRDANYNNTGGANNTVLGYQAGFSLTSHSKSGNVLIGYKAGYNDTANHKLYIENSASSEPLIYGEFDNDILKINGALRTRDGWSDDDGDTRIELEQTSDDDIIRFFSGGSEFARMDGTTLHLTTESESVYIGLDAGRLDSTSTVDNVGVGLEVLYNNTEGDWNTAVGNFAMSGNTEGRSNAATGFGSLFQNTTGHGNSAFGYSALLWNNTGSGNTGIGFGANAGNQAGDYNTMIGTSAGGTTTQHSKSGNVFIGYSAGFYDTTDNKLYIENTNSSLPLIYGEFDNDLIGINGDLGIGTQTPLRPLHIKSDGVADSVQTIVAVLESNISNRPVLLFSESNEANFSNGMSIEYNGAAGGGSLNEMYINNVGGAPVITFESSGRVGIGTTEPSTILQVDGGSDVSLSGGGYFMTNTESSSNITIDDNEIMARNNGAMSPLYVQSEGGDFSIHFGLGQLNEFRVKSDGKTGIGEDSPGDKLEINTVPGEHALNVRVDGSTRLRVYQNGGVTVGYTVADPGPPYALQLQNSSNNLLGKGRAFAWETYSDGRFKFDQQRLQYGLREVLAMQPKSYVHQSSFSDSRDIGLIAQEVFNVVPEVVYQPADETTDSWSVDYNKLIPVLINAIQEQQSQIAQLQNQNRELYRAINIRDAD